LEGIKKENEIKEKVKKGSLPYLYNSIDVNNSGEFGAEELVVFLREFSVFIRK
jgi:hypothetical protein